MKKIISALPLALVALSSPVLAETDLGGGFTLSGKAAIVSDYRFRGYSQTNFRPAVQLGIDVVHTSGFYIGNWNSNVSDFVFPEGNLEMDFYGGWAGDLGNGVKLDAGALYYYYPGSLSPKENNYRNLDLHIGLSVANYSLTYSYTPTDFFSTADSKGTWYLDASTTFDLGNGWGLIGHVGYQKLKNQLNMDGDAIGHYVDYKVGVTKQLAGWGLELSAVGATRDDWLPTKEGHPSGRLGVMLGLNHAF